VLQIEEAEQELYAHEGQLLPKKEQRSDPDKHQPANHRILAKRRNYAAKLKHFRVEFQLVTKSVARDLNFVDCVAFQVPVFGFNCFEIETFE